MAYVNKTNIVPGHSIGTVHERGLKTRLYNEHRFDTQITNASQSLRALINAQLDANGTAVRSFSGRTSVEITNNHATATLYWSRGDSVTAAIGTPIAPAGGFASIPAGYEMDIYLVSSAATQSALIVEVC